MASSEVKAAGAANNLDMEIDNSSPGITGLEYDPESPPKGFPLMDYNEGDPYNEDPVPALKKRTNGKRAVSPNDRETKKKALR